MTHTLLAEIGGMPFDPVPVFLILCGILFLNLILRMVAGIHRGATLAVVTTGGLDATAFAPILKELYTDERIWTLVYLDNPLLKWINKFKKFTGKKMPIPIHWGNPTGMSHTFATGQSNINASKYTDFYLTRAKDYGFIQIDHETLLAAKDDPGAFLRAKEPEIDGMLQAMGRRMAIEMYGNGSGAKGQIA